LAYRIHDDERMYGNGGWLSKEIKVPKPLTFKGRMSDIYRMSQDTILGQ
jgi:hypothetical protein